MEAAAETIRQLSRRTLPDRPHQLSTSLEYRAPHFPEDSRVHGFEEQRIRHCQYMTLVSHGDRGILVPRSYHEFREEPPKPVAKEISALARPGAPKKTLSLSDYQNKKANANSPAPPAPKVDRPPPPRPDTKPSESSRRPEAIKPAPIASSVESLGKPRPKTLPDKPEVDMSLPPKPPPSLHAPKIVHDRKRPADLDEVRPLKRPKPATTDTSREDLREPTENKAPASREDPIRRKPIESAHPREQTQRDRSSSFVGNGRSSLSSAVSGPIRAASPAGRPRNTSVNGFKDASAEKVSNSASAALSKGDGKPKVVPPLLSPLRVGMDHGRGPDQSRADKRRRDEESNGKSDRVTKPDSRPATKRPKSPPRIPALLSPTLPPMVEEALERKQQASKGNDAPLAETRTNDRDATGQGKPLTDTWTDKNGRTRKSLMVRLKIPLKLRDRFAKVMQSSTARKGVAKPVRASEKYPAGARDHEPPSPAKRPRMSDVALKAPEPTTPSKRGTAMSRVSSSNSLAPTPADLVATPSLPDSAERSSDVNKSKTQSLKAKEVEYSRIGRTVEHKADPMLRPGNESAAAVNGSASKQERLHKRAFALMLESTCAFMMSFHVQDRLAAANHKPCDGTGWQSCLPLIEMTQHHIRRGTPRRSLGPVYAISLFLQAVATDKLIESYTARDEKSVDMGKLLHHTRNKYKTRAIYRDVVSSIENPVLRIRDMHIWPQVDDAVEASLQVLRAWCEEENVDWTPELTLTSSTAKSSTN